MTGLSRVRDGRAWLVTLAVAGLVLAPLAAAAQTPAQIQAALDAAYAKYKDLKEGANADYHPGAGCSSQAQWTLARRQIQFTSKGGLRVLGTHRTSRETEERSECYCERCPSCCAKCCRKH